MFDGVHCRWFVVINSGKNFGIGVCSYWYVMMGISMMGACMTHNDRIMFGSYIITPLSEIYSKET